MTNSLAVPATVVRVPAERERANVVRE